MLKRILIDNFRCFANFEFRPTQSCLVIGENGSGKTTFSDAMAILRDLVVTGSPAGSFFFDDTNRLRQETRQHFEIDATVGDVAFTYSLTLNRPAKHLPPTIERERLVSAGTEPLLDFRAGELGIVGDDGTSLYSFPSDPKRSALAVFEPNWKTTRIAMFKEWLTGTLQLRPDPRRFRNSIAESERIVPGYSMEWFLDWYRHLYQEYPERSSTYLAALTPMFSGLQAIALQNIGSSRKLVVLNFVDASGKTYPMYFDELSDGQRMLIMLYAVLHFPIASGRSVIIDEPDNYVGLDELQPWILSVDRMLPVNGQFICVSHHPEMLAHFGLADTFYFRRAPNGVVRAELIPPDESGFSIAERMARGWLHHA